VLGPEDLGLRDNIVVVVVAAAVAVDTVVDEDIAAAVDSAVDEDIAERIVRSCFPQRAAEAPEGSPSTQPKKSLRKLG